MNYKRIFFLVLALCLFLTLQAQMVSHLTYRRYTTQDGLPQMQTERLWQDSRGYIYIGTLSGFVRFDGRSFTPFLKGRRFNIVGFQELADEVRALGFFRQWTVSFDDLETQPLDPQGHWLLNNLNAGSLPNGYVLLEDSLEEHRRLCRMTKQGFEPLLTAPLLDEMTPDRKLYLDSEKAVYVPTEKGLWKAYGDKKAKKAYKLSDKGDIYTLLRTGRQLLAFSADGIYSVENDCLRLLKTADWSEASYGLTVRMLRSGHLVIADEHTVYLYDGKIFQQVVTGINLIRDVLVDRWDRLWVATYQGAYCFFDRSFTNHRLTDENDIVRAIAVDDAGGLVMGTLNGKLLCTAPLSSPKGEASDSAAPQFMSPSRDDRGASAFYAPSAVRIGNGVYMPGNGDVTCITRNADGKPVQRWLELPRDRYQFVSTAWGKLIVGSRTCILAYDPATAHTDTLTTEILHPWCAVQDSGGLLWIGSSSGLFCIDQSRKVTKHEYGNQKLIISAMDADQHGNVFFASADSLFVISKTQISNPNSQISNLNQQLSTLNSHEIRSIHVSPRGYLVVAVVDGLFVCRINEEGQPSAVHFFNHLNGFTMTEPLKAMMAETADGTVWLPGVEEMTSFRPEELLALEEEYTYITPPLRWWQHWWVWLIGLLLLSALVWSVAYWYEKRRNRRRMIRLQREKLQREKQIQAIREKATESVGNPPLSGKVGGASPNGERLEGALQDIVRMTEKNYDEHLTFRTASGTIVADVKDIAFFKGDGNYSQIVTFHDKDTVLTGLGTLEKMLSPEVFVRADRSTLVNIHLICTLLPKQRRCIFRSPTGQEVETTLLAPAFKRLQELL